jgi:HEPN domain-containing protein
LTLVKIAQKDFEAAELLFEKKLYPQAIYTLQQSLQKASKAALLKLGSYVRGLAQEGDKA